MIRDWLGLGLGLGLALGPPRLGLAGGEFGGGVLGGGADPPPAAGFVLVCVGVGDAERLADGDGDRLPLVSDRPVPSEEFADTVPPGDAETAGRMVVAEPLASVGPLPSSWV